MRRAFIYSLLAHVAFLGFFLLEGAGYSASQAEPEVYTVRLVSGGMPAGAKEKPPLPENVEKGNVMPAPPVEVKKIKPKPKDEAGDAPVKREISRRPKVRDDGGRGGIGGAGVGVGVGGVQLEGEEFPFQYYIELFVNKVGNNWKNPVQDPETSLAAQVYFRISRTGRITGIALKKGSGNFIYDQAAMRAVLASNPLPPLPEGYRGDFLGVTCEIVP
jgi:TonB family protein